MDPGRHAAIYISPFQSSGSGLIDRNDLQVPLASAPGLDDLGGHDIDQDFRKCPPFRVAVQMVGGLVPAEIR